MEMRNINQQLSHLSNQNDKRETIIRDLEKHVLHVQSEIDDITIELSNLESRMRVLEKKELQKHTKFLKDELDCKVREINDHMTTINSIFEKCKN